jgi:DNA-directed RNA polymerase subunit beta
VIPYRGSWLDFEFDAKDIVHARIDRRRKLPATSVLRALGMDTEQILNTFYATISYKKQKGGWATKFNPEAFRGIKLTHDLIDVLTLADRCGYSRRGRWSKSAGSPRC